MTMQRHWPWYFCSTWNYFLYFVLIILIHLEFGSQDIYHLPQGIHLCDDNEIFFLMDSICIFSLSNLQVSNSSVGSQFYKYKVALTIEVAVFYCYSDHLHSFSGYSVNRFDAEAYCMHFIFVGHKYNLVNSLLKTVFFFPTKMCKGT